VYFGSIFIHVLQVQPILSDQSRVSIVSEKYLCFTEQHLLLTELRQELFETLINFFWKGLKCVGKSNQPFEFRIYGFVGMFDTVSQFFEFDGIQNAKIANLIVSHFILHI